MAKPHVLITSQFLNPGGEAERHLLVGGAATSFSPWHGGRTEDEMVSLLRGVDVVVAGMDPFSARVLRSTDRLKAICRAGVGYDAIDLEAATAAGVVVSITAGTNCAAVAEYTLALILTCSRKLPENLAEMRRGRWAPQRGHDLAGSTLGVVGLGLIGREVARLGRAFRMRVLAFTRYPDDEFAAQHGIEYASLERLLAESDFVSLHARLEPSTRHLINAERLALMKPTAYLVNTARGAIVDTEALYQALKERRIAGAALDVYEQEPLGESPLRELDNVYLFPHAGGVTEDALRAAGLTAAENALRVLRGEPPTGVANPEVLRH